ncbi:flagellar hook-length control protein FliK [Brevundimonas sp.]|uniref:flagellar hook-length control protein FliK n=1 Tax=Brevundimonas sp. TaxID=1871086 RepID=UPI003F710FB5
MSALTPPSVVAPSVPSVPKGPSGEGASGFRNLLAVLSGEDAAVPVTKNPAEPPNSDEAQVKAEVEASAVAGFLAAPSPPPTPLVLPAAGEATSTTGAVPAPAGATSGLDGTQATTLLLVHKASTFTTTEPEVLPREQTTTPLLTDKGPTAKPPRPEVLPPLPAVRPLTGETSDTELTLAETAAARGAVEARARTGAPPLRPSAERTSRLLGPLEARTSDGSRGPDPARPTPAAMTATPAVAANPAAGPADFAAAAMARDIPNGGETEGPPFEPPPPVETATAQTQAAAGARETGVSQLSRATIEATAQIAAQILRRLEGRSTRFEMALTPDELGRVDVKLDIDSEGRLNARLAFDNPAAATDLRGRADELRRQLEEAGFQLAEDAFEFADRDSGSSAFDRGQDARNGSSRAFAAATRLNTEIDVAQPPLWLALSLSPSGVDMKV